MVFYRVTIFKTETDFLARYDQSEQGVRNTIEMSKRLGYEMLYQGSINTVNEGIILNNFVEEANKNGDFDKNRLEELLK